MALLFQTRAMDNTMQHNVILRLNDGTNQELCHNVTMQGVQCLVCPQHQIFCTCRWLAVLGCYDIDNAENIRRPWEALYNEDGPMELVCYTQGRCHGELQQARMLLLHVLVQLGGHIQRLQEPACGARNNM